jgi:hypothetical protein
LRHGARRCSCLVDPHRASTISVSLVSKCHNGCGCVMLWFTRVRRTAQHLRLQHSRFLSGLPHP